MLDAGSGGHKIGRAVGAVLRRRRPTLGDTRCMRTTCPARMSAIARLLPALALLSGCGAQTRTVSSRSGQHAPLEAVSQSRGCPSNDAHLTASRRPDAANVLVPAQPIAALICRYWGSDDPGHRKRTFAEAEIASSAPALQRMVRQLDALPPYPVGGASNCPVFGGRSELIYFQYSSGSNDPIRIEKTCLVPVSNGQLVKAGLVLGPPEGHWPDEGLL